MKKLLTILLILISISAISQTRPPIVTNELQTNMLRWDDLLMYRDSLIYFRPINETSFQVKRPSSSAWSTYDFTEIPDSFYISDLDIWITVNEPITQGDSTFYVRSKPGCPNCWQYSYDNSYWVNWFCGETGASNLSIHYNADDILGIIKHIGLGSYTDSLYFKVLEADSGRVPTIRGDSVYWLPIPKDSLFDAYSGDWLIVGDTIPKQNDSIQINGVWIGLGESVDVDSSNTNELDSISINGVWCKNGGEVLVDTSKWEMDLYGFHSKDMGEAANLIGHVGIGENSTENSMLRVRNDYSSRAIDAYSSVGDATIVGTTQRGIGILAQVVSQDGLPFVAQSTVHSPLVADFRGSQGIAANKLYLGGGAHSEKSQQLYIDGVQEIHGSSIENYGLLIRDSKGLYCDSILRLGGYLSGGVTYPSVPGSTGQFLALKDSLTGILEFVDQDSSLWSISSTGIKSKTKAVAINSEIVDTYNLAIKADGSDNTLGLWNSGTGNILEGRNSLGASVFNVDKDGATTTTGLTVGSGATITRSGTIASKDIWTGTAAEYAANTAKDGITPQASTTIAFILD